MVEHYDHHLDEQEVEVVVEQMVDMSDYIESLYQHDHEQYQLRDEMVELVEIHH